MILRIYFASVAVWMLLLVSAKSDLTSDYRTSLDEFTGHFFTTATQAENTNKNAVMSPLSAHITMTLISIGAKGGTKKEILNAIFLDNVENATSSIKKTMHNLRSVKGVILRLASKIFAKPGLNGKLDSVVSSYKHRIKNLFRATVQQVDFSQSASAAQTINKWVDDNTDHFIKDIIDENSLSSQTSAVIVNAIYFKGNWEKRFDPERTRKQNFTTLDGNDIEVDMMYQDNKLLFGFSTELDSQIVVLPCEKNDVSMVIILPHELDGIKTLEKKLEVGINKHLENLRREAIILGLPKMTIKTTTDIKDVLKKLGVQRVFSPEKSEVQEIVEGEENIYISNAIQKAFIQITEEGAEAAAATDVEFIPLSASPEVICDHPFVFIIRTKDAVLFIGSFYGN